MASDLFKGRQGQIMLAKQRQMISAVQKQKTIARNDLTPSLRAEVLTRDNCQCQMCGRGVKDGVVLHVDHIYPVKEGGLSVPWNLLTLCADCNEGKKAKLFDETFFVNKVKELKEFYKIEGRPQNMLNYNS